MKRGSPLSLLIQRWRPPRESRPLLASVPVFAGCERRRLYRVARWGDVIEVHPGDVLVREDHTDYWFFVILSGSVQVTRRGREIATMHRGDHFGEIAIVGFRPQYATVTAVEPTVLFVVGRQYLLTLAATDPSIQRALFPNVSPDGYRLFVRELHAQGRLDWEKLRPRYAQGQNMVLPTPKTRPGRELSWSEALELLSHHDVGPEEREAVRTDAPLTAKRSMLVPAAVVVAVLAVLAPFYHPPAAVISPGETVDVVQDISITGAKVHRPTGPYLLTPVVIDRPTVPGLVWAKIRGRTVVRAGSPDALELDPATARRLAHAAFLNSHREAIALAEKTLRVDAGGVTIAIRDRGIIGPSAGLIYALAIVDMLDPGDLADGRAIAATGELLHNGTVAPVGFVSLKAVAADGGNAVVFIVPRSQKTQARRDGMTVLGVRDLSEAVRVLSKGR